MRGSARLHGLSNSIRHLRNPSILSRPLLVLSDSRVQHREGLQLVVNSYTTERGTKRENSFDQKVVKKILDRKWFLNKPDCKIDSIRILENGQVLGNEHEAKEISPEKQRSNGAVDALYCNVDSSEYDFLSQNGDTESPCGSQNGDKESPCEFHVIRDDLLHPLMGGNKLRKLDGIIPQLLGDSVSDVVTCGGLQSAHTAAVAVACAERGLTAHLLLRGERPQILTGYALISHMYGHVTYVPRAEYADRDAMFAKHVDRVSSLGGTKTGVIKEGAGDAYALLGLIRMADHLSRLPQCDGPLEIVVDSGTGTTAVGLALGAALLNLPWTVSGVMLACGEEYYVCQQERLLSEFWAGHVSAGEAPPALRLEWIHRETPRKFGRVFEGEFDTCQKIARQTGILLDPIYTLAGWEVAERKAREMCKQSNGGTTRESRKVFFLHTGGTLGLFGLAQRYPKAVT